VTVSRDTGRLLCLLRAASERPLSREEWLRHNPSMARRGRAGNCLSHLVQRAWFIALFLCGLIDAQFVSAQTSSLPNILILYADDMGYGDLNIQNPESKIPTPNLDRLAREGMRFTDAHSSSGICSPSRYAMLTGGYHWRKFHEIVNSFGPSVFDPGQLTLSEMLRAKGYHTGCIGKWHLGWNWKAIMKSDGKPDPKNGYRPEAFDWSKRIPGGPVDHGFDYYFGDDVPNFPPYTWFENDRVLAEPNVPLTITPKTAEGNWEARPGPMVAGWDFYAVMPRLTEKCVEWIAQQKGSSRPFFLFFPWTSPHAPIVPSNEYRGKTAAGGYGDFMHQSDAHAGRVLRALDDAGFRENTLVIFTSDNGPEQYAYERIRNHDHRSMGNLRGLKRDIWEGGHRVPLVIRWPGVVEPGRVSGELVSQIDLMATIAAIVEYSLPSDAAPDSLNLLPLLRDKSNRSPRRAMVHNTMKNHYAVRQNNWVLIDGPTGAVTKVPEWFNAANGYLTNRLAGELYDLSVDLAQRKNLYGEQPEKVADLRSLLKSIQSKGQRQN
jgi:arylsulfatase A